jgi:peptidylprolyl isomerase
MRGFFAAVCLALLACPSALFSQAGLLDGVYARMYTSKGLVVARLTPDLTPLAVASFVGLAEGTIENAAFDLGSPFYDGSIYHRVVPGHVIQTGSAASERSGGPGYSFPNQIHASVSHDHAGALNQANGGPHTNGSQFTITLGDRSYLDWDYIVFGDVVAGLDVVMSVIQGDVLDSVRIERRGAVAQAYRPDTESFQSLVRAAELRVAQDVERKAAAEEAWVRERWPELSGPVDGVRMMQVTPPSRPRGPGEEVRVRYTGERVRWMGHLLGYDGPEFEVSEFASGEDGGPGFRASALPFPHSGGEPRINAGLDEAIAEMGVGEIRVVIVPASLGYGSGGLYLPEVPGEPRFVIGPNTLLTYTVQIGEAGS